MDVKGQVTTRTTIKPKVCRCCIQRIPHIQEHTMKVYRSIQFEGGVAGWVEYNNIQNSIHQTHRVEYNNIQNSIHQNTHLYTSQPM